MMNDVIEQVTELSVRIKNIEEWIKATEGWLRYPNKGEPNAVVWDSRFMDIKPFAAPDDGVLDTAKEIADLGEQIKELSAQLKKKERQLSNMKTMLVESEIEIDKLKNNHGR